MKKKLLLYILFALLFTGCANVHLVHRDQGKHSTFSKTNFEYFPTVGIAAYGDNIPLIHDYIMDDVNTFAERQLFYQDIAPLVSLNEERTMVSMVTDLRAKHPDLRYAIVVWEDEPKESQYFNKEVTREDCSEKSKEDDDDKSKKDEDCEPYDEVRYKYTTRYYVEFEALLIDLKRSLLLAKSSDVFVEQETYTEKYDTKPTFKKHTLFGKIERLFFNRHIPDMFDVNYDLAKYPKINGLDNNSAANYFYAFFKKVKNTNIRKR